MIKVLIIDDSAVVRQTISRILSTEKDIVVIGTAPDPFIAADKIEKEIPDVIILDLEMPKMDGLTFLKNIMSQHPIPIVVCSSLTEHGSDSVFKAIRYGAVDIITKPKLGTKQFIEESQVIFADAVRAASKVNLTQKHIHSEIECVKKLSADVMLTKKESLLTETTDKIIAVGASTGGTEALSVFLKDLPADIPGLVIVQHMPEHFTRAFAERLDSICNITVREAKDGDSILCGQALIAPGNFHILIQRSGAHYYVEVKNGPLVSRHRPSVDVLFRSAANNAGKNAVGILMTGMGDDGAKGLLEMKKAGAFTIAQNEESCVVFGMPKEAIKIDAVDRILPLDSIANELYQFEKKRA